MTDDEIDPKLPGEFTKRNIKFLLNEKVKTAPTDYEEDTGNRRPDDESRVNLRKRTRHMFADPEKMNVGTLFPHEIAYSARVARSRAQIDYHNAAFDKKVLDMMAEFDKILRKWLPTPRQVVTQPMKLLLRWVRRCNRTYSWVADVSGSETTQCGDASSSQPM